MKKDFKIAYLLLIHNNPKQVNIFIKQLLNQGNCEIYIHVSKKNKQMINQIIQHPNVYIFSEYEVRWASYEIIEACLFLMRKVKESNKYYNFIHFSSGSDLIIKKGLFEFLDKNLNKLFINVSHEITDQDISSSLYKVEWPRFLMVRNDLHPYRFIRVIIQHLCRKGIVIRKNKNSLPKDYAVYCGKTWFTIPYNAMEYALNYLENNPEYSEFWYNSLVPDLLFFQTLFMNSPFRENIIDDLFYIQFGKGFRNWNHPIVFTECHIELLESSNKYFARKFDCNYDEKVVDYFVHLLDVD